VNLNPAARRLGLMRHPLRPFGHLRAFGRRRPDIEDNEASALMLVAHSTMSAGTQDVRNFVIRCAPCQWPLRQRQRSPLAA